MAVAVDGTKTVLEQKTAVYYELEGEGNVLFCESHITEDGQETVRTAVRKGDGLMQTIQVGDRKTERTVPHAQGHAGAAAPAGRRGCRRRRRATRSTTGRPPGTRTMVDVKEAYTFKEKKTIKSGRRRDRGVSSSRPLSQGAKFDGQLLGDARPLVGKVGVMEMRMEKEPLAKKLDEQRRSDGGDFHPGGQGARPRLQHREADAGGDRPGRFRPAGVAAAADRVAQGRRRRCWSCRATAPPTSRRR